VQDHDPVVQKAVHRIQPFEQSRNAVMWAREVGFRSVNIDLIYGLPHQTPESFERTLDEVLTLEPDRFAVFNYAYVPWIKPAQKIIKESTLPSAATKLQLLKLTIEKLTSSGYVYIGMDHFARADDELALAQKQRRSSAISRVIAPAAARISMPSECPRSRKPTPFIGRTTRICRITTRHLDQGRLPLAKGFFLTNDDRQASNHHHAVDVRFLARLWSDVPVAGGRFQNPVRVRTRVPDRSGIGRAAAAG
jgi:oxygen-independent coproporphyrinogen III oxidase